MIWQVIYVFFFIYYFSLKAESRTNIFSNVSDLFQLQWFSCYKVKDYSRSFTYFLNPFRKKLWPLLVNPCKTFSDKPTSAVTVRKNLFFMISVILHVLDSVFVCSERPLLSYKHCPREQVWTPWWDVLGLPELLCGGQITVTAVRCFLDHSCWTRVPSNG